MDKNYKNKNEIVLLQKYIVQQMKFSGVTMQVASEYLNYANKSSISRTLAKHRMPALDAIKLLALIPVKIVNLNGISFEINIVSTENTTRMKACEELFAIFQNNVFLEGYERKILPNSVTWNDVAAKSEYNDGESARRAWFDLNTPLLLVIAVMKITGKDEITASNGIDTLTISTKQKKVAGPLSDNQVFIN